MDLKPDHPDHLGPSRMRRYRPGLPPIPRNIARLPIDKRGYPVPWFVEHRPDGEWDFRIADYNKRQAALRHRICWVCGGGYRRDEAFVFVLGPMCAITRTTSEPPCHRDCAEFALKACPFLLLPKSKRREAPEGAIDAPGAPIHRNPGVAAEWACHSYKTFKVPQEFGGNPGWLIEVGEPHFVQWWAEGREATRAETLMSIESGYPALVDAANNDPNDPEDAIRTLTVQRDVILNGWIRSPREEEEWLKTSTRG